MKKFQCDSFLPGIIKKVHEREWMTVGLIVEYVNMMWKGPLVLCYANVPCWV
jgi:hypothetical protein